MTDCAEARRVQSVHDVTYLKNFGCVKIFTQPIFYFRYSKTSLIGQSKASQMRSKT